MTHDELLAKISIPIIFKPGIEQADIVNIVLLVKERQALRAVVELHKPFTEFGDDASCEECFNADYSNKDQPYPCDTIQAITEQLK